MARATHLTISTADRIRLDGRCGGVNQDREDEDGDNEVRQEVQVSVTYALEAGDTNLVRLAAAKALEVKLAHEAVWDRIGAFSTEAFSSSTSSNGFSSSTSSIAFSGGSNGSGETNGSRPGPCSGRRASGEEDDEDRDDEDRDDGNDDPDDGPQGAGLPPDPPPVDPPMGGPARGAWYMPGGSRTGSAAAVPELPQDADADPITGPQKILIRSRAKKAGLTPYSLESLVYQQFKVWKVEKLTKEQATSVLDALNRDLKERELQEKNGTQGSAVAGRAA